MDYELTACNVQLRLESMDTLAEYVEKWIYRMRFPLRIIYANCAEPSADAILRILKELIDKAGPDAPNIIATVRIGSDTPDRIPRFCTYIHHGNENTMVARTAAQFCRTEQFHSVSYFCDNIMHCREALRFLVELHHENASGKLTIIVDLPDPVSTGEDLLHAMAQRLWTKEYLDGLMAKYAELHIDDFLHRICFVPDFETVCRTSLKRSLWLSMDAESAVFAVQWCKAANRNVVHDISIIGFGNAATYLHHGITSCSVDKRVFGYRIAHAAMGSFPAQKTHKGFFESRHVSSSDVRRGRAAGDRIRRFPLSRILSIQSRLRGQLPAIDLYPFDRHTARKCLTRVDGAKNGIRSGVWCTEDHPVLSFLRRRSVGLDGRE